jgi:magnesium-transporting ATPase (P-type)
MATGDNTLTAISVARECNIIGDQIVDVFFGEVFNGNLVWKCSNSSGLNDCADNVNVPW